MKKNRVRGIFAETVKENGRNFFRLFSTTIKRVFSRRAKLSIELRRFRLTTNFPLLCVGIALKFISQAECWDFNKNLWSLKLITGNNETKSSFFIVPRSRRAKRGTMKKKSVRQLTPRKRWKKAQRQEIPPKLSKLIFGDRLWTRWTRNDKRENLPSKTPAGIEIYFLYCKITLYPRDCWRVFIKICRTHAGDSEFFTPFVAYHSAELRR